MAIWDKVKKKVDEPPQLKPPMAIPEKPPDIKTLGTDKDSGLMPTKEQCEVQLAHLEKQLETLVAERTKIEEYINQVMTLKKMFEYALAYHNNDRIFFVEKETDEQRED